MTRRARCWATVNIPSGTLRAVISFKRGLLPVFRWLRQSSHSLSLCCWASLCIWRNKYCRQQFPCSFFPLHISRQKYCIYKVYRGAIVHLKYIIARHCTPALRYIHHLHNSNNNSVIASSRSLRGVSYLHLKMSPADVMTQWRSTFAPDDGLSERRGHSITCYSFLTYSQIRSSFYGCYSWDVCKTDVTS